jgi:Sec-independent protein secretion pathway component TatC
VVAAALPGVDPVSMILEMIPLVVLYEGSILLAALAERRFPRRGGGVLAGFGDVDSDDDDDEPDPGRPSHPDDD